MPSGASNNQRSDVYAGLAGETAQGRVAECCGGDFRSAGMNARESGN